MCRVAFVFWCGGGLGFERATGAAGLWSIGAGCAAGFLFAFSCQAAAQDRTTSRAGGGDGASVLFGPGQPGQAQSRAGQSTAEPSGTQPSGSAQPWAETWAGAEMRQQSWAAYTGTTFAPFGSLYQHGWRVRIVTGYSSYRYDRADGTEHEARSPFAETLLGYQWTAGSTTLKAFVGGAALVRDLRPPDPNELRDFSKVGFKGALETWTDLPADLVFKFDVSAARFLDAELKFTQARADAMIAKRFSERVLFGLEASALTDRKRETLSAGLIAQYAHSPLMTIEAAGGVNAERERIGEPDNVYGRVQLLIKY